MDKSRGTQLILIGIGFAIVMAILLVAINNNYERYMQCTTANLQTIRSNTNISQLTLYSCPRWGWRFKPSQANSVEVLLGIITGIVSALCIVVGFALRGRPKTPINPTIITA